MYSIHLSINWHTPPSELNWNANWVNFFLCVSVNSELPNFLYPSSSSQEYTHKGWLHTTLIEIISQHCTTHLYHQAVSACPLGLGHGYSVAQGVLKVAHSNTLGMLTHSTLAAVWDPKPIWWGPRCWQLRIIKPS